MSLNATNNTFVFNMSRDFIPQELEDRYRIHLEMFQKPYASVLDYINSTIKSVTMPTLTMPTVTQKVAYGRDRTFRGSKAPNDVFTRELSITFKLVDSHMTYHILQDAMLFFYTNIAKHSLDQFILTTLDLNQKELCRTFYKNIILTNLSDTTFSNSDVSLDERDATLSFVYNDIDIEYMPRYGDEGAAGQLIDEYSKRINVALQPYTPSVLLTTTTPIITVGNSLLINAVAIDIDTIQSLDFYNGLVLLATFNLALVNYTIKNLIKGTHTFTVVATDKRGIRTTSIPLFITVNDTIQP